MSTLRAMLVLGLLEAFGPLSMDLYLPQLPQLATALGTSDALAQATMSACMVGLGPASSPQGRSATGSAGVRSWWASRPSRCCRSCARSLRGSKCS
jgi:hypothetical protein